MVSGGNEYDNDHPALADHFYLNNGKGSFAAAPVPAILRNKSCVRAADIDKDGDMDLFIGGLADAKQYGAAQDSYLLINDGKGIFSLAAAAQAPLAALGMVTSAAFADIDQNGWPDLVLAGEWMPVTILKNNSGRFTKDTIPNSSGWWQSIQIGDVNGDGKPDILAGNWGYNNKLHAGKTAPVKLYIKDFDKNGSTEQILTYTINGEEYPFLAKDELERALPVLKKAYLKYSEVAGKSVQYMFYDLFTGYTEKKAELLGSAVFYNKGDGVFEHADLPPAFQLAPVFCFLPVRNKEWLLAGNFYGTIPYEGRYDALQPGFLKQNGSNLQQNGHLPGLSGEFRRAAWIKTASRDSILVLTRNNQQPVFLK